MTGLFQALDELVEDDGKDHAIRVAERWRNTLEEMLEACNESQRNQLMPILGWLNDWLIRMVG